MKVGLREGRRGGALSYSIVDGAGVEFSKNSYVAKIGGKENWGDPRTKTDFVRLVKTFLA